MTLAGHVVLVGLPGAGKTTVGRLLAARLGCRFVDFDEEITRREGMAITDIFASRGEPYFRELEAGLTGELAAAEPAVLSPGGGWIMQQGLVELLRPPAVMIHLRVSPETAVERMGAAVADRPLLAGGQPRERVVTLWEARRRAYESADFEVATDLLAPERVADAVLSLIERSGRVGS